MHVNDHLCETANTTCFVGRKELIEIIHSCSLLDSWLVAGTGAFSHTWFHPGKKQSSCLGRI